MRRNLSRSITGIICRRWVPSLPSAQLRMGRLSERPLWGVLSPVGVMTDGQQK